MRYSEELIIHADSLGMQDRLALRLRRYEMFRRWLEVDNAAQVGREFGVTPGWARELIYHARFDLIRKNEGLRVKSTTSVFLEAVDEAMSEIKEMIEHRGGFLRRRLSKKERLRQESDLYEDLREMDVGM